MIYFTAPSRHAIQFPYLIRLVDARLGNVGMWDIDRPLTKNGRYISHGDMYRPLTKNWRYISHASMSPRAT